MTIATETEAELTPPPPPGPPAPPTTDPEEGPELFIERGGSFTEGVYTVFARIPTEEGERPEAIIALDFDEEADGEHVAALVSVFLQSIQDVVAEIDAKRAEEAVPE